MFCTVHTGEKFIKEDNPVNHFQGLKYSDIYLEKNKRKLEFWRIIYLLTYFLTLFKLYYCFLVTSLWGLGPCKLEGACFVNLDLESDNLNIYY